MEMDPIRDPRKVAALKKLVRGSGCGSRDLALLCLGLNTAFRIGDLVRLKVGDVTGPDGKILAELAISEQKTGKARRIPINSAAARPLAAWLRARGPSRPGDWLFPSRKGGHLSRKTFYHKLKAAGRELGLSRLGTHSMRKTFAFRVYQATGGNLALVQKLLNHESAADTLRYIGITREEMDMVVISVKV
jgi:integrase